MADRGALSAAQERECAAASAHALRQALDRMATTGTRNAHQTMRHAASRYLRLSPAATGEDEPS